MIARMLKYRISSNDSAQVVVLTREGAVIRAVGMQGGEIYAWAETPVQANPLTDTRTFRVVPTGGDLPDPGAFVGTVFDGPFVWHVYEMPTL
jgi:triacylglycerol esterase/lipase EstA (alpha/beta hydrolase family)